MIYLLYYILFNILWKFMSLICETLLNCILTEKLILEPVLLHNKIFIIYYRFFRFRLKNLGYCCHRCSRWIPSFAKSEFTATTKGRTCQIEKYIFIWKIWGKWKVFVFLMVSIEGLEKHLYSVYVSMNDKSFGKNFSSWRHLQVAGDFHW